MTQLFESTRPLETALDYHTERHNLIVSNIVNVDTPGYRPREISFEQALGDIGIPMSMATTDLGHMGAADSPSVPGARVYEETWATPGNDGNYVRLEHEMSRLQANSLRYRSSTQMVSHHLGLLRYGITGR